MKNVETITKYTLDGHELIEAIVNLLKVPNGVRGRININFLTSHLLEIDEEGGISLYHHPEDESERDNPPLVDLNKPRVFIETTEIEHG